MSETDGARSRPGLLFLRRAALCALVVLVCAAPGLFYGKEYCNYLGIDRTPDHTYAMGLTVAIFIALFTVVSSTEWFATWVQQPLIRRALWITFGTKALLLLIYCYGWIPDVLIGAFMAQICHDMDLPRHPFWNPFIVSMLHASGLLVVLAAYFGIALIIVRAWSRKPLPGHCLVCGYDLRASPVRCPECGTPNPAATTAAATVTSPDPDQ